MRRARGWRACIVAALLVALAWPSLGPLPFVVPGFDGHFAEAGHAHPDGTHHVDASSIPGSPTHPDDHHCVECDVLKHLARCLPSLPALAISPPVVVGFVTEPVEDPQPFAADSVHVPPARAPPPPTA